MTLTLTRDRYIGKLLNGKQFDANTAGAPFNFRLGAGEVIKGWDQGVAGMAVGGERKLTVSSPPTSHTVWHTQDIEADSPLPDHSTL
jgi:FKBP-type peptidyl-prolyl cis-trans isomerase (trigger factor)